MADPEARVNGARESDTENYGLKAFQSSLSLLAHILIGIVVGITLMFAIQLESPLGPTSMHIMLCVMGYQLLMAQGILALCPHNGWSSSLRLVDKRRAHTVLQILGSGLAIAGSIIKILDKTVHWNTYHGQFALVAMVFTTVSLVNGLTSLYAYELRKCIPGNMSKIPHIVFGVVAFVASCISLCYGLDYGFFKNWATTEFTYIMMGMCATFTFIIIVNPMITAFSKTVRIFN